MINFAKNVKKKKILVNNFDLISFDLCVHGNSEVVDEINKYITENEDIMGKHKIICPCPVCAKARKILFLKASSKLKLSLKNHQIKLYDQLVKEGIWSE